MSTRQPDEAAVLGRYMSADAGTRAVIEGQLIHRRWLDRQDAMQAWAGLAAAAVLSLAFLGAATFLIYTDHDAAGSVLGSIDLVALVTVFIIGRAGTNTRPPQNTQ
jgi:hypothetical protein